MIKEITPIDFHLALRLREIRILKGITQEKLAELAHLSFQQIQKYESAKNRIPSSRLFEFSQLLQVPISDFFSRVKTDRLYYSCDFEEQEELQKKTSKFQQDVKHLISAFSRIDDDLVRRHLILIAEDLAKPKERRVKVEY